MERLSMKVSKILNIMSGIFIALFVIMFVASMVCCLFGDWDLSLRFLAASVMNLTMGFIFRAICEEFK